MYVLVFFDKVQSSVETKLELKTYIERFHLIFIFFHPIFDTIQRRVSLFLERGNDYII